MEHTTETIGDRIERARKAKGMIQAELARKVGISQSALLQIENGQTKHPKPHHLFAIADALGVNARWLAMGGQEEPQTIAQMTASLSEKLPPEAQQASFDFVLFQAQQPGNLIAQDVLSHYFTMTEKMRLDMHSKKRKG